MVRLTIMFAWCFAAVTTAFTQPEKKIEKFITEGKVPGMFIAVVRGDSVLYEKGFGLADIEKDIPVTASTCMELGSISKVFTAEAIYYLHNKGLLNIQDSISKYFEGAPASWSGITIRQLLSHTSGIQNYLLDPRFRAEAYFTNKKEPAAEQFFRTITPDSMVRLFYSLPLEFKAGYTWSYSNTGYYLLGKIGEVVSGKPFFGLVKDKITDPLQMFNTKANELSAKENCLAKGYFLKDSFLTQSRILQSSYAFSAGAWATSGEDMICYLKAIHKRKLPSDREGFEWRMFQDGGKLPFTYEGGRFYSTFHGIRIISHNGGTPGFSSSWFYAVEKNISVIVLANLQDYASIDQLAWEVLSFFEPALTYPQQELPGAVERKVSQKVLAIFDALKENKQYPEGLLSAQLEKFMGSENGKALWNWYFGKGFPVSAYCVDKEQIDKGSLYRFILRSTKNTVYPLTVLANEEGQLLQIQWW